MSSKLQVGSEMTRNCLRKYPSSMEKLCLAPRLMQVHPKFSPVRCFATSLLLYFATVHPPKVGCTSANTSIDVRTAVSPAPTCEKRHHRHRLILPPPPPLPDMSPHSPVHATSPLVSTPRTVQEGPRQRKVLGYHGSVSTTTSSSGGSSNATGS